MRGGMDEEVSDMDAGYIRQKRLGTTNTLRRVNTHLPAHG